MIKWEYLTAQSSSDSLNWDKTDGGAIQLHDRDAWGSTTLNSLGKKGWDLVSTFQESGSSRYDVPKTVFIFKRIAKETLEPCENK